MIRLLLAASLMLHATTAWAAPAPEGRTASVPIPAGIADAAGKVGFVANAKDGIDTVDLVNGETLWSSKDARRPLVAFADKFAAQAPVAGKDNAVRIVVLDVANGKQLLASDPVVFPDWVTTGLALGRTFNSSAQVDKGDLLLSWEAHAFYAGGAAPTPEILEAARKQARGVARVSLKSGKVQMLDKVPVEAAPPLAEELRKVKSQQYWTGHDWRTEPFVMTDTVSALEARNLGGGKAKLSLRRWDRATGKEEETVPLLEGKELWPQVSGDGRHVFVHQALVKEQLPPGDYAWWVFDLATGKQVAKLPFEGTMAEATVLGDRLYVLTSVPRKGPPVFDAIMEQPRALRAMDLKTGKKLWDHPVEPVRTLPPPP